MPATTTSNTTARNVRRSTVRRKDRQNTRCEGNNGSDKKAPYIVANSLSALVLRPIPGLGVFEKVEDKKRRSYDEPDDYYKMYADLLECLKNALRLVTGEVSTFDPLKSDLHIGVAMAYVTKAFENNILPKGCSYNIDRDDEGYYFTIYDDCYFANCWHAFEIKNIVEKLYKENRRLHDLFIIFLRSFKMHTEIEGWWDDGMGFCEEWMEERLLNWEEGDEEKNEFEATLKSYRTGDPKKYEKLIRNAKTLSPDALLKRLSQFDQKNDIIKWMSDTCAFLKKPGCMHDFIYYDVEGSNDMEGLRFSDQVTIIWSWDDAYTGMQEESIDMQAQRFGINPPVINLAIRKKNTSIDLDDLRDRCMWPAALSKIWESNRKIVVALSDQRKKKKSATQVEITV